MFNFFKRSKSRIDQRQQKNACATNESNREKLQKPVEENPIKTTAGPAAVSQSLQQLHQYEHESIGERALSSSNSNTTKNGFFDIMAKGKNRRNNGKNKHQQQQQLKQKANGPPTPSAFTDHDQRNNKVQIPLACEQNSQQKSKPQSTPTPSPPNPVPLSVTTHQKLNNENNSKKVDSNDVACENNKEIYEIRNEPKNSKIIENNYKTNTNANINNELATNCVHDNDVARHPSDKNSEQNQNGDCTVDDGNENGAADFIKGIIFEKYKRPLSPIHIRPAPEFISCIPTTIDNVDAIIMGQQPTKVQRSTKFKAQPSFTSSQASSTPSTPYDEKDIFYEAAADIPVADDRFSFASAKQVNRNDNPDDDGDTSTTQTTTTTNVVPSENFESANFNIWANENKFSGIVHEPSNNNNILNVRQSAVDNNSNSNCANGDGYDDRRNIVINNDANLSVIEEKFNSDVHDSPDSGIDVEISNISQVIDKLQQNETTYSNKSTSLSGDSSSSSGCGNNGGSGCDQSAFKECLENSNDTSYENSENYDIDTPLPTTNVSIVNSNVNETNNNSNNHNNGSAIKQSDEKQQQYNLQKKRTLLEDTVSLPDIVESTGNGIVIMSHTDEDVNQRQHHNNNGIVDKISTVGQTNGIEK